MGRKPSADAVIRTTISVPMSIKRRMEREAPGVNWSNVASAAFAAKLDALRQENNQPPTVATALLPLREALAILEKIKK